MSTPNIHRIWPCVIDAQSPAFRAPYRKLKTHPCDERNGLSAWHLVALGIYPYDQVVSFLGETVDVESSRLIDDLREHISRKPNTKFAEGWARLGGMPNGSCFDAFVGLGIEQLCRLQGLTLLGHYRHEGILGVPMSPVVMAYEKWIEHEIYLRPLTK
jgi:hypothetical protein